VTEVFDNKDVTYFDISIRRVLMEMNYRSSNETS